MTRLAVLNQLDLLGRVTRRNQLDAAGQAGETIRAEIERLERRPLVITVVGLFSSGKSSLLNALLGETLLPVGLPETTETTHLVHIGQRSHDWQDPLYEVGEVHEASCSFLPQGTVIVDTPGFDSVLKGHDRIAGQALRDADVLLVCADCTQGPTAALVKVMSTVGTHRPGQDVERVLVLTKADLLSEQELADQIRSAKTLCAEHGILHVLATSAVSEHGTEELLAYLRDDLAPRAAEVHARSMENRIGALARRTLDILEEMRASLTLDTQELDTRVAELHRQEVEALRVLRTRILDTIGTLRNRAREIADALETTLEVEARRCAERLAKRQATSRDFFDIVESQLLQASDAFRSQIEKAVHTAFSMPQQRPDLPPPLFERIRTFAEIALMIGSAVAGPLGGVGNLLEAAAGKVLAIMAQEAGLLTPLVEPALLKAVHKTVDTFHDNAEQALKEVGARLERELAATLVPELAEVRQALTRLAEQRKNQEFAVEEKRRQLQEDIDLVREVIRASLRQQPAAEGER